MMERTRISKQSFYRDGGLANPKHFRKMRSGAWTYWRLT